MSKGGDGKRRDVEIKDWCTLSLSHKHGQTKDLTQSSRPIREICLSVWLVGNLSFYQLTNNFTSETNKCKGKRAKQHGKSEQNVNDKKNMKG